MAIVRKGLSTTMGLDVEGEQRRARAKKRGRGDLQKLNVMISSCIDLIFVIRRGVKRKKRPAHYDICFVQCTIRGPLGN